MMHFMASIHFTWHLWELLLHMTSTTPLITFCKPTPRAGHWSLSHQISPSGREKRKVKSLCSECGDLWTLWPVHTWVSVCVTVCDSKGLTKECMKSAGTSDNWAICCKVTAEQPPPPKNLVLSAALTRATEPGFCNISRCVRKRYGLFRLFLHLHLRCAVVVHQNAGFLVKKTCQQHIFLWVGICFYTE